MTIFHQIAARQADAFIIDEDDDHLAFLDIFPAKTCPGQTIVIPKQFQPSQFSAANPEILASAVKFAQQVARKLEQKLDNVLRVVVVIEGLQIDYLHLKLYPVYQGIKMNIDEVEKADPQVLTDLQERLLT